MEYSVTQASNITAIAGVVVLILGAFHVKLGTDEVTTFLGAAVAIFGIASNWYHRYKKGDLTAGGFRRFRK